MSENKITIEEAKKQISEGFSSIYSKDDVLHLLSVLEVENTDIELDESTISDISSDIAHEIGNSSVGDIINDYDLSMSCREVELDNVDFSIGAIKDIVKDVLENHLNNK